MPRPVFSAGQDASAAPIADACVGVPAADARLSGRRRPGIAAAPATPSDAALRRLVAALARQAAREAFRAAAARSPSSPTPTEVRDD